MAPPLSLLCCMSLPSLGPMAVITQDGFLLPSRDAAWFLSDLQLLVLMLAFFFVLAMFSSRSQITGRIRI